MGHSTIVLPGRHPATFLFMLTLAMLMTSLFQRPTLFMGVPRVWKKLHAPLHAIIAAAAADSPGHVPSPAVLASAVGLDRCRLGLVGAAPMHPSISEFFDTSVALPIFNLYGMTENFALSHCTTERWQKAGTVGKANPYCVASLADGTDEIQVSSRASMLGYVYNPAQTQAAMGPNGMVYTGDVGAVDDDGFLTIVGRIKELIITAGGENIAPVNIEDALKLESAAFSNAVVVGEGRKFLSVLLTLTTAADGVGGFTDRLVGTAAEVDPLCKTVGEASVSDVWMHFIDGAVDRANSAAISRAQQVKKWELLPTDLSINGGELGPTLKLIRPVVTQKYAKLIDSCYGVISKSSVRENQEIKRSSFYRVSARGRWWVAFVRPSTGRGGVRSIPPVTSRVR